MKWHVSEAMGKTFRARQQVLKAARETRAKTIGSRGKKLGELYRRRDKALKKLREGAWSRLSQ